MPGLIKVATYSSESLSPRKRSTHGPTMYGTTTNRNGPELQPHETSLPRISLMHGARSAAAAAAAPGRQWSFLHTLLSQDEEEQAGASHQTENQEKDFVTSTPRNMKRSSSRVRRPQENADQSSALVKDRNLAQMTMNSETAYSKIQLQQSSDRRSQNSSGSRFERKVSSDKERKVSGDTEGLMVVSSGTDNKKSVTKVDSAAADTSDTAPVITSSTMSQWTTCRALPNLEDDPDYDDNQGCVHEPDAETTKASGVAAEGDGIPQATADVSNVLPSQDGHSTVALSRATSTVSVTGLPRRKRPLLLPPIMLPPIYTVKPTPLRFRDSMFSLEATPRSRRPVSDEEWEQLKDCRYIRHRPFKPFDSKLECLKTAV